VKSCIRRPQNWTCRPTEMTAFPTLNLVLKSSRNTNKSRPSPASISLAHSGSLSHFPSLLSRRLCFIFLMAKRLTSPSNVFHADHSPSVLTIYSLLSETLSVTSIETENTAIQKVGNKNDYRKVRNFTDSTSLGLPSLLL